MMGRRFNATAVKNPYKVLGIKMNADKKEIKKAYRVLARKHHPDTPGGSQEKFQEIQDAYEQIKTGVWIRKDGGGEGGAGGGGNKYQNFRYTTASTKGKRTYEDFYTEMHSGRRAANADMNVDEEPLKSKHKNPMGASDVRVEAWFRFIMGWSIMFCTLRIVLFLMFPPKHQPANRRPPPEKPRRPPPPKPLANQSPLIA